MAFPSVPQLFDEAQATTNVKWINDADFNTGTYCDTGLLYWPDGVALAQDNNWTNRNCTMTGLVGASMVAATDWRLILMFGGNNSGNYYNDTRVYNPRDTMWFNMSPAVSPPARAYHQMVWNPNRMSFVMFGGRNATAVFNDTWEYNPGSNTWKNMTSSNQNYRPPNRYDFGMIMDRNYEIISIFGGRDLSGNVFGDSWYMSIWSYTANWYNVTGTPSYPACYGMGMTYLHEGLYGAIVFGGRTASGDYVSETWRYYGYGNWQNQSPASSPSGRINMMMVERSTGNQQVMILGGTNSTGDLWDLWYYNYPSNTWSDITSWMGGAIPQKRVGQAGTSYRGDIYFFGGYDAASAKYRIETIYMTTGGNFQKKLPMDPPPARTNSAIATPYFGMIVYGGTDGATTTNETWRYLYYVGTWENMTSATNPGKKQLATFTYDDNFGRCVLFGGITTVASNETWEFNIWSGGWVNYTSFSTPPPARYSASMTYDFRSNQVTLFGGFDGSKYFNDTWEYDISAHTWSNVTPVTSPPVRCGAGFAGEYNYNTCILFGGVNSTVYFNDTWAWDGTAHTWTKKNTPNAPAERAFMGMTFDRNDYRIVIQGGHNNSAGIVYNDTWYYDMWAVNWTNNTGTNPAPARAYHAIGHSDYGGFIQMFGGSTSNNDTLISGQFKTSGQYITRTIDADQTGYNDWLNLYYEMSWNDAYSLGITFQTAANNDNSTWTWTGENGAGTYYERNWNATSYLYTINYGSGYRYFRIRVQMTFWGLDYYNTLYRLELNYNRAPDTPVQVSPIASAYINTSTPTFSMTTGDKDNDMLYYNLRIYNSGGSLIYDFDQKTNYTGWSLVNYTPGSGANYSIQPVNALADGQYSWRVRAADNIRLGSLTSGRMFLIDTSSPTVPTFDPESTHTKGNSVQIDWSLSTDALPSTGIYYYAEVDDDPGFNSPINNSGWISGVNKTTFNNLQDGVKYYFRVRSRDGALNSGGWASSVSTTIDASPPPVPVLAGEPQFTQGTTNAVSWNAVTDAGIGSEEYYVEGDDDPAFGSPFNSGWVTATSASFSNLADAKPYSYRIKSRDAFGWESAWSSAVSSTQDAAAPSVPVITSEPAYTIGLQNPLYWDPSTDSGIGGVVYDAQASEDQTFATIKGESGWLSATHYTFNNLEDGKKYYYRVAARDTFLQVSVWSSMASSTQDNSPPAVPVLSVPAQFTPGTSCRITWPAVSDGQGIGGVEYWTETSQDSSFTKVAAASGWANVASWTFTGLADGMKYYYRVKSRDALDHESAWSKVESTTQDASAPSQPVLEPEPQFTKGIENNVTWSAALDTVSGGVQYQLQWSTDPSFTTIDGDSGWMTFRTLNIKPLADGKTYYYRVRATDALNLTTYWSSLERSTQDNSPPTAPVLVEEPAFTLGTENSLSWLKSADAGAGGVMYMVEVYAGTQGGAPMAITGWLDSPEYAFTGLEDAITYHYRVKAKDALGFESAWSGWATSTQDAKAPATVVTTPAPGQFIKSTSYIVTGTSSDTNGVSYVEVSTDGGESWARATGNSSWTYTWAVGSDGKYTLRVRSVDNAGRAESPARSVSVMVDNTAPRLLRMAPYSGSCVAVGTPVFSADIVESGSGVNGSATFVIIDGKEQGAAVSADALSFVPTSALAPGDHNFTIRVQDNAGNAYEAPKVKFTVDTDTPVIRVVSPASASVKTRDDKVTVAGQMTDITQVKGRALINGVPGDVTILGIEFSFQVSLLEGNNVIVLTGEDLAGHVASATLLIFKDGRGPTITVSGPDTSSTTKKVTVSGQVSDQVNISSITVTVNGIAQQATVAGGQFSLDATLKAGSNTIDVKATDEVGNTATVTRTVNVEEPKSTGGSSELGASLGGAGLAIGLIALIVGVMAFLASRRSGSARTPPPPVEEITRMEPEPQPEPAPEPAPMVKPKKKGHAPVSQPAPAPQPEPVEEPKGGMDEFRP